MEIQPLPPTNAKVAKNIDPNNFWQFQKFAFPNTQCRSKLENLENLTTKCYINSMIL
jgi:hypothetical protein